LGKEEAMFNMVRNIRVMESDWCFRDSGAFDFIVSTPSDLAEKEEEQSQLEEKTSSLNRLHIREIMAKPNCSKISVNLYDFQK
jgi:hypothetical protein